MTERVLVLGASGFVASRLLPRLRDRKPCVVSRGPCDCGHRVDLSSVELPPSHPLFAERPERVIVLARPASVEFEPNRRFANNLQRLLSAWVAASHLEAVQFASTAMVYSGKPGDRTVGAYGPYEYFKLEGELFLDFLHRQSPSLDVQVYRLGIGFCRGPVTPVEQRAQFLYRFIEAYESGHHWSFTSPEQEAFGTSWFDVDDFVDALAGYRYAGGGYRQLDVASGFFSYRELHDYLAARFPHVVSRDLHLFKTRFELERGLSIPARRIEEALDEHLAQA